MFQMFQASVMQYSHILGEAKAKDAKYGNVDLQSRLKELQSRLKVLLQDNFTGNSTSAVTI